MTLLSLPASQDSEVRRTFMRTLEKQGIKFKMGTKVSKGEVVNGKVHLTTEPSKGGAPEKIEADAVLVSIGEPREAGPMKESHELMRRLGA